MERALGTWLACACWAECQGQGLTSRLGAALSHALKASEFRRFARRFHGHHIDSWNQNCAGIAAGLRELAFVRQIRRLENGLFNGFGS